MKGEVGVEEDGSKGRICWIRVSITEVHAEDGWIFGFRWLIHPIGELVGCVCERESEREREREREREGGLGRFLTYLDQDVYPALIHRDDRLSMLIDDCREETSRLPRFDSLGDACE